MIGLDVLDCDNDCEAFASQIDLTSYFGRKSKKLYMRMKNLSNCTGSN